MTTNKYSSKSNLASAKFHPVLRPIFQACALVLVLGSAHADGSPDAVKGTKSSAVKQKKAANTLGATSKPFYAPSTEVTVVAGPVSVAPGAKNDVNGARNAMPLTLRVGKSTVVRLPEGADRISVGNPNVADITLLKSNELYLLGKTFGTTNIILWRASGRTSVIELTVAIDTAPLEAHARGLWPNEKDIRISSAADSIVLSGSVSSTPVVDQVMRLAEAYASEIGGNVAAGTPSDGGATATKTNTAQASGSSNSGGKSGGKPKVVNLLRVLNPQQVMLEVKVAEINRSFLESLGVDITGAITRGSTTYGIISQFANSQISSGVTGSGQVSVSRNGRTGIVQAQNSETLVKLLAEPNIMTLSGQEGSFLAGGSVLIPSTETVDGKSEKSFKERDYGVSLKFTPTVLENGRIHLKVAPEVSEIVDRTLGDTGSTLPQLSIRRASSVVQLMDGQSLAIAGLIKGNSTLQANRFPGLGELPILGALFRSSDFINDRTELVFVVTPRLVKPLAPNFELPGDNFVMPSRTDFFLNGRFEAKPPEKSEGSAPAPAATAKPAPTSNREATGFAPPLAKQP